MGHGEGTHGEMPAISESVKTHSQPTVKSFQQEQGAVKT